MRLPLLLVGALLVLGVLPLLVGLGLARLRSHPSMPAGVVVDDAVRTVARHLRRSRVLGGAAGAVAALGSIFLLADRAVYLAVPLLFLGVAAGALVGGTPPPDRTPDPCAPPR